MKTDKRTTGYKELRDRRMLVVIYFFLSLAFTFIALSIGKKLVFEEYPLNPMPKSFEERRERSISPTPTDVPSKPLSNDPIDVIRSIGEELGYSNEVIKNMIGIARCESSYREGAVNVNRNGSMDRGIFQINTVHAISNKDAFDCLKNIRFAYELYRDQGFRPWLSSVKCWI